MNYEEEAKNYLEQYGNAKADLKYLKERTEVLRSKVEGVRSTLDFERGMKGNHLVPLEGDGTHDPKAKEKLLFRLIYNSMEYSTKLSEAEMLCLEIEKAIDSFTEDNYRLVLKYKYISLYTFERIGVKMHYSDRHIRRLHSEALEQFGKKMSYYVRAN